MTDLRGYQQDCVARYAYAGDVIAAAEKLGTLRLGADGAVLYSGPALDDALVLALVHHGQHVRQALAQRWRDRVVSPAPAAEAA